MALFLLIETGTAVCSVALARDSQIVALSENSEGQAHAKSVAPYIDTILAKQNIDINALDAIVVSEGPGSYTGLRVGISVAKGICYGIKKPLIAVSSLLSLVYLAIQKKKLPTPDCLVVPMIDARRMEVYTAVFDAKANQLSETKAEIIDENSFADILQKQPVLFIGDGAGKCRSLLRHPNAYFADISASAIGMLTPGQFAFEHQKFVDIAYFEPFYLKDFVVTTKKKVVEE